jgi:hypothetical protein
MKIARAAGEVRRGSRDPETARAGVGAVAGQYPRFARRTGGQGYFLRTVRNGEPSARRLPAGSRQEPQTSGRRSLGRLVEARTGVRATVCCSRCSFSEGAWGKPPPGRTFSPAVRLIALWEAARFQRSAARGRRDSAPADLTPQAGEERLQPVDVQEAEEPRQTSMTGPSRSESATARMSPRFPSA